MIFTWLFFKTMVNYVFKLMFMYNGDSWHVPFTWYQIYLSKKKKFAPRCIYKTHGPIESRKMLINLSRKMVCVCMRLFDTHFAALPHFKCRYLDSFFQQKDENTNKKKSIKPTITNLITFYAEYWTNKCSPSIIIIFIIIIICFSSRPNNSNVDICNRFSVVVVVVAILIKE